MPLILSDLPDTKTAVAAVTPRFFSSKFTGDGKRKSGLLGAQLNPTTTATNIDFIAEASRPISKKFSATQNGILIASIPMAPILRGAINSVQTTVPTPAAQLRHTIETDSADKDISFYLTPQGAKLFEDTATGDKKMPREFIVQYRMELYVHERGTDVPERTLVSTGSSLNPSGDIAVLAWDIDPLVNAAEFVQKQLDAMRLTWKNPDALTTWMTDEYVVYDAIASLAEIWSSDAIAEEVVSYIKGMPDSSDNAHLNELALQMRYLENYPIPLEAYGLISAAIVEKFDEETASVLAKQNCNLLLNYTLADIASIKDQLSVPPTPATPPVLPDRLSSQQRQALTTNDPLAQVVAGAGTGKSTCILGRVDYLQACGVPASDITVVSFTNAAADTIKERNPNIGSMTIASMIHDIYALNHPSHQLSSIDTIVNSIDIFHPTSNFAAAFRKYLLEVDQNKTGATTALNTFIENNYDRTIELLDDIKQTSLELEIIICYQRIDEMNEPAHVQSRFLIIDEVQDNSIFEFIYVLKYIAKHKQSLFVVGDASQTLYEFRAANPRALNTLEGSGVFTTFKLTTNYRSNQEILDFANVVLGNLETNQIANIRLQANSLETPTAESFQDKVKVDYRHAGRLKEFITEDLPGIVAQTISREYVDTRLAAGEQVAFLAHSRREVAVIEKALQMRYPDKHIVNLVSERPYSTDIFSKYIKFFWNDVLVGKPSDASFIVVQGIKDNMEKLTRNGGSDAVRKGVLRMLEKWWLENADAIRSWEPLVNQGQLSYAQFFERLRDNMLSFEIRHNAVRTSLTNQKNRERKETNASKNADLIVSTIHGVKGMEFDHVVVLHKEDKPIPQDAQRMFYVAFTRAMKSLYVLSYGKIADPAIVSAHEVIVGALTQRDKQIRAESMGLTLEELEELENKESSDSSDQLPQAV